MVTIDITRRAAVVGVLSALGAPALAADGPVVKDVRNLDPRAARFVTAQGTESMPNVLLLGGGPDLLAKIKGAALAAGAAGAPVRAIMVGPVNVVPAIEVYAKGQLVTQAIDPRTVTQERLVLLLKNTKRDFYR